MKPTHHAAVAKSTECVRVCNIVNPCVKVPSKSRWRNHCSSDTLSNFVSNWASFLDHVITGRHGCLNMTLHRKGRAPNGTQRTPLAQKKARISKSKIKAMLIVFFDAKGVVRFEFVPTGQVVRSMFYVDVLKD